MCWMHQAVRENESTKKNILGISFCEQKLIPRMDKTRFSKPQKSGTLFSRAVLKLPIIFQTKYMLNIKRL